MSETESLFVGLPSQKSIVATFKVTGEPVSKARARFTKRGSHVQAYTPEKTRTAERVIAAHFQEAGGRKNPDPEVTFGIAAAFHNGTRQRRDVDNMLKLVLDGLNGVAWVDDNQVVEVSARKFYAGSRDLAHTEVTVYKVGVIDRDRRKCAVCAKEFVTYASWDKKRHCSAECVRLGRIRVRERKCKQCGENFLAHGPSKQPQFCSRECRGAYGRTELACEICGTKYVTFRSWQRTRSYCSPTCRGVIEARIAKERRATRKPGTCQVCGSGTSRKEYVRCNACRLAQLKPGDAAPLTLTEETP